MPMSLPEDLVEQARREREQQALSPITSSIDRMIREGMGGIESIAKGAAEQAAPVVKLLQGGELKLPTLDDLTPQWMRDQYEPKPVQQPMVQPQQQAPAPASGMPQAMPTAPQAGQQAQAAQRPMALPTGSEGGDYGPIDNSSRAAFVRTAYPYMLEAAGGDKNLAELMLAKAISENGDVGSGGGFIGNNFCYDGATEVLTSDGWVRWPDADLRHRFATLNPLTEAIEYQRASYLTRSWYSGRMFRVATDHVNLLVTPEHRMWVRPTPDAPYQIIRARDLSGRRVEYMAPHLPLGDLVHGANVDAEASCDFRSDRSSSEQAADFPYIGFGQLSVAATSAPVPSLRTHVGKVIGLSALKEMIGAHAGRVVTAMANLLLRRQRYGVSQCERETMGKDVLLAHAGAESSVPLRVGVIGPDPTRPEFGADDRPVFADLRPESLLGRSEVRAPASAATVTGVAALDGLRQGEKVFAASLADARNGTLLGHRLSPSGGVTPRPSDTRCGALRRKNYTASGSWTSYDGMVYCATVPNGLLVVRRDGKVVVSGNSGIKGEGDAGSFEADTWEDYGNGRVNIRDRFAAYSTPQVGFRAFMQFLHDNSRYAPALARYQQTGDASQLFRDIRAAGYATDPLWADKVENIRANQVAPIVRGQADQDMQRLSLNAVPAAAPGRTAPPAPAGVASAPAGAPPAPWETAGASDGGPMLLKENDETAPMGGGDAMLPGDGGFAPMQGSAPGMEGSAAIYDARDADSGPRESRPAPILPTDPTVSDLAYTQSPTGMSYGPIQQGAVQGPPAPERPYLEQATDWVQRTAAPLVEAATNAYGREISEGNRVQDEIDAALDAKSNEFANMVRAPIDDVRRGVNIANRVLMATPQATADVVNAALERFGLGRDALGVDLPLVGRIGIADIVDLGPTSNIGMGRTGMVQRPVQSIVPNVGGAIEDVAGAGIRAAREGIRTGAEALGRGLQGVGREVAGGLMDLNPAMTPRVIGDGGPGIGRAMADGAPLSNAERVAAADARMAEQGSTSLGMAVGPTPGPARRFYHGTASEFGMPDPGKFDPDGLFGPGYYLTSDPRVAGSYAVERGTPYRVTSEQVRGHFQAIAERTRATGADGAEQLADAYERAAQKVPPGRDFLQEDVERMSSAAGFDAGNVDFSDARLWGPAREARGALFEIQGPNVRAVDVPEGLRLLDPEAQMKPAEVRRLAARLAKATGSRYFAELARTPNSEMGYLSRSYSGMLTEWRNTEPGATWARANQALAAAGYDGLQHTGGKRVPMLDDAGRPIEHDVTIIFPESLTKIRNGFSGEVGGGVVGPSPGPRNAALGTQLATDAGNALAGSMVGAVAPADSNEERLRNTALGAAGFPVAGRLMRRAGGALGTPGIGPAGRAVAETAPREPAPVFYSQLRQTLDEKMPNRASAQQIMGILKGSPVKPDEIAWTGLDDFLRGRGGRPFTKQEVLDFLDQNAVQVEEVVKGEPLIRWRQDGDALVAAEAPTLRVGQDADGSFRVQHDGRVSPVPFATVDEAKQAAQDIATDPRVGLLPKPDQTRYGQYTLPGGENYRELLLTLPQQGQRRFRYYDPSGRPGGLVDSEEQAQEVVRMAGGRYAPEHVADPNNPAYRSSHWDEPNVLAHVRFNERTAPDGKRVLLIEEIQSDWHQAGRKQGYNATPRELTADEKELQALNRASFQRNWTPEEAARAAQLREAGVGDSLAAWATAQSKPSVPDAPFKKTWPELAIKRMVRWAAENGFDQIAWPPGAVHAERFSLAQSVDDLRYITKDGSTGTLVAYKGGEEIATHQNVPADKLGDYVGQDVARRLFDREPDIRAYGDEYRLTGRDLTSVGGEGMKGFYDKIVPDAASKIGKKFGARVGMGEIQTTSRYTVQPTRFGLWNVFDDDMNIVRSLPSEAEAEAFARTAAKGQPVHTLDITPQMRESVVKQGQPMFSALPFDPSSAAMGGAAGAMSEGEDGERGDPLRTAAGIGLGAFGARIARKPGHTVATGLKPGQRYEFRVRVVPLRDLITSHLDNLAENPGFLGELQPRVRSRAASRVQIDKMVQAFDPEQVLMDTHRVDSGPMIVGPDMMVESGNGRAIALRRLSQENPEAYADYVQALREELPYYGLTEDALKGIDQPVLVRERVTPLDPAERARFASEANAPTAAQMSSMEQALADARNIGDGPLGRIVVGEDQTIDEALLSPENGAFVRAFMATVPDTERGKMLEANGNLSVTGLARVKAALLARTYPGAAGERVATAIVESTDAGLRNVQNAVMGSLPSMARVEGLIAAGDVDAGLSLADDIAAAVDVYARLKRAGILVGDYLQQAGMFGGRETTPLQDAILGYLNENARAPRRLRSLLEGYAREVEATAGSAGDMFGGPAPAATKEEVLDGVLRRLGAAPGADQGADVGRTGAAGNLVEGAAGRPIQVPGADSGAQAGRGAGGPSLLDDVAAAENLTPEQQIARLQAENDRLRAERRGGGRRQQPPQAAPIGDANLPPVGDDLIPPTGGEAGRLQVEGASQPAPRPGPVGDILPRTGGPEGTLAREGAPEPQPRPTPIPRDVLPPTGGPEGVLRQPVATEPQTGPTPFARPTPIPEDAIPATGGPEIRLRVEEDRKAVEQLMADSAGARRYDEQQRRQISEATARYAEDVRTLSQRIEAERAAGNTPDRLMAERAAVANRLHATMLLAEGRRGPAARAFREADRQAALLQRDPKRAVAQMHQRFGGQENAAAAADEYTRMVEDGATPIQLARFWAGVERGKITGADLFGLYRRFNMLSGPRTIEVNALSGALNLGYEVVSQAVGQTARGRGAEAAAEFAAPFKAMGRAFNNLAETMWHGVSAEQAARGDIPRTLSSRTDNRAAKGVLTAMEVPDRFNAAVDQFYRTMTEDWAATMLAHKRARADGLTPRSDGWADAVAKHLQEIRDDVDVLPEIKRMADHVTFAEEPGGIGRGLEEFRRRAPLVANVLFPFIRTPYNIASRAVDLSPLGVVRTGAEVLTGRGRGRENVSRRVRDNALGLAAAYWAYDQAQQGNITGAGPDDPEKLAMLRATGWQPYSVKVGDQYWSYANFAPFSLALSMGAAAHEAKQYAKPGETDTLALLGDAATRTAKVVTDMTVLQGIGAIIKSIQDPDRYGGAWLTQFVGSLVPAGSLLNTIGQATDDTVRRAERDTFANQVSQGVQARIPGLRQQVPAAQDPLGRAVPNDQQGAGALNPFRPTQGRPDSTIQAFLDAGIDIGKPPTSFTVDGVKIEMTPEQQRQYQRYMGEAIEKGIDRAAGASDRLRAQKLKQLLDDARASAAAKVQADIGRSEIRSRVRERRAS